MLTADTAQHLAAEARTRQIPSAQLALRQGALNLTQVDIVETLLRPTDAVPGYEILGLLGKGGMGVVYRARQTSLDRVVALKTVLMSQLADAAALSRFEQEAQVVARLAHPNIIAAYDFGRHSGRLFFAMELVEGEDVEKLVGRCQILDEALAWGLIRQAAAGLVHAQQAGIVHRDIKPANLLLVEPPAGFPLPSGMPLVKIADFGLALLATETQGSDQTRLTMVNSAIGSPHYMAPEQLSGGDIDHRADIYALGATLWQMLVGQPPLAGKTLSQIISSKLTVEMEDIRQHRGTVSPQSAELLAAMLRREREERLGSYIDLLRRIDTLAAMGKELNHVTTTQAFDPRVANPASASPLPTTSPPVTTAGQSRISRRTLLLTLGGVGIGASAAVAIGWWGMQNADPGPRNLVAAGRPRALFNGVNLKAWNSRSGAWYPGQDDESGTVLVGQDGVIARPFSEIASAGQPLKNYLLEFGFSFQKATAVELHFDLLNGDQRDDGLSRHLVRMTPQGSILATRPSDKGALRTHSRQVPLAKDTGELHSVRLERQSESYWITVDNVLIGTLPIKQEQATGGIRLAVKKGPAWFEDISVDQLIDPSGQ